MPTPFPRAKRPCDATTESGPCPFRVDAPPGEFTAERFEQLAASAGGPGAEAPPGGTIFACHHTTDGRPHACAGWLAVCGHWHLGIRQEVIEGRLPIEALDPGDGWPELFESYDDMAMRQAAGVYDPARAAHPGDLLTSLLGADLAAAVRAAQPGREVRHEPTGSGTLCQTCGVGWPCPPARAAKSRAAASGSQPRRTVDPDQNGGT